MAFVVRKGSAGQQGDDGGQGYGEPSPAGADVARGAGASDELLVPAGLVADPSGEPVGEAAGAVAEGAVLLGACCSAGDDVETDVGELVCEVALDVGEPVCDVDGVEVDGVLEPPPPSPVTARPTLVPDSLLDDSGCPITASAAVIPARARAKPPAIISALRRHGRRPASSGSAGSGSVAVVNGTVGGSASALARDLGAGQRTPPVGRISISRSWRTRSVARRRECA